MNIDVACQKAFKHRPMWVRFFKDPTHPRRVEALRVLAEEVLGLLPKEDRPDEDLVQDRIRHHLNIQE